jgi:hypothetical protein
VLGLYEQILAQRAEREDANNPRFDPEDDVWKLAREGIEQD